MQEAPAQRVWDTALGQLQLQVTRPNFDTWLKDTVGLAAENGSFIIGTPNDFVSEWLSAKMGPVIAKTVGGILGREVSLKFQVIAPTTNGNGAGHEPRPPQEAQRQAHLRALHHRRLQPPRLRRRQRRRRAARPRL